jgi:hypothetical protein
MIISSFLLQVTSGNRKKSNVVTQLHYTGWPDHGVPKKADNLLRLHSKLR